jgi:hypothetical protein
VSRIFTTLAILAVAFLAFTLILGLSIGDLYGDAADESTAGAHRLKSLHFLCGVACSIVVLLVNSVSVTYFVGTSRWAKEVTAAYELEDTYVRRCTHLKRRCFPLSVISMLVMVVMVALGAAADPATGRAGTAWWATPHMLGSLLGMTWIALSFVMQYNLIRTNFGVIADVMQQVEAKQKAA